MTAKTTRPARSRIDRLELRGDQTSATAKRQIAARIDRAFGHWAPLITRVVVRQEDVNASRGGVDRRCAIDVHPAGRSPVHYEVKGETREVALGKALDGMERALRRLFERRAMRAGRTAAPDAPRPPLSKGTSLVGRREGRSKLRREMARVRPEKQVRDLFVDTAQAGVSATDRKSGSGHTARRNARKDRDSMTTLLEDSLTTPSRKSTRRSANRSKPSQGKERTAVARSVTPSSRHRRRR